MKRLFLLLTAVLLAVVGVGAASAQDVNVAFLCEDANTNSGGAITVTGSIDNIFDVNRGLTGNTYCRIIVKDSAVITQIAEVGDLAVVNRGVIQAVDIFGMFPEGETWNDLRTPVRVCLRGTGDVLFLDADTSRRNLSRLNEADSPSGYSCASLVRSGTVVLVPPGPPLVGVVTNTDAANPASVIDLTNCQVVTTFNGVFLRREPHTNARIRWQFEDSQILNATGIAGNWYRIDFRGQPGWLSAAFVRPIGNCLAPDGSVVGTSDPFAPGDVNTFTPLTNCEITTNFNGVNLRREPNLRGSIRWTFEDSQTLDAVGVSGNWYLIAFRGSPGWINAEFVNASGDC